jgi:hypothetical protein
VNRRRPRVPIATKQPPAIKTTGVSSPGPVSANGDEPLPVSPVDEGLVVTAATVDEVVVVEDGDVVVVVELVDVVDEVVVEVVVEVVLDAVVGALGVTVQQVLNVSRVPGATAVTPSLPALLEYSQTA